MAMNIFRFMGDLSHQIAIVILTLHLYRAKNARGISIKTQELRLLVFSTRYLDLFTTFYSAYNTILKVYYLVATVGILIMCKTNPIKRLYNHEQDPFPHWKCAVLPCFAIALVNHIIMAMRLPNFLYYGMRWHIMEDLWTFSICLESIAIIPQLITLRKYRLVENLTGKFVFFLGMYRFLYILNWIYRSYHEPRYRHRYLVYTCGVIQTLLYADFFYQYIKITCRYGHREGALDEEDESEDDDTNLIFEVARTSFRENEMGGAVIQPLLDHGEESDDGKAQLRSRSVIIDP